jgi:hypothetical protein
MSNASRIKAEINELKSINKEMKRLCDALKPLRLRKKTIEQNILNYMNSATAGGQKALTTIKMNDIEVVAVEKKCREKLKKDEKETNAINLLQQSGIQNAPKVYKELQEIVKGKENVVHALKMKDTV